MGEDPAHLINTTEQGNRTHHMKNITKGLLLGTAVAVSVIITGCSSAGYSKGDSAAKGMEKTGSEIDAIVQQTELTLTSLSNLVYAPAADLVPQFKKFAGDTKKLASLSKSVADKSVEMKERAKAYFTAWDQGMTNISNADLKKKSEARRADVSSAFDEVAESLAKSQKAFSPFLSDLKDIEQMLSLDLTKGGIGSVQSVAKSAIAHGDDLRDALTEAAKDINALASKMSSQGPSADAAK